MFRIIHRARARQRSVVITLLDLKNAFGEVHHTIISKVLLYHHISIPIQTLVENLYTGFTVASKFLYYLVSVGGYVYQSG